MSHPFVSFRPLLALAAVLLAPALAHAQAPNPNELYLQSISYGGSGCPQGSVGNSFSNDRKSFTLIFDSFVASSGPGVPVTEGRKNCQLNVNVRIPAGMQLTTATFDYRGYVLAPEGVSAETQAVYYFDGGETAHQPPASTFTGPVTMDYVNRDVLSLRTCGGATGRVVPLNVNAQVRLVGPHDVQAQVTNDSIDGRVRAGTEVGVVLTFDACTEVDTEATAAWTFGEGAGDVATDATGHGHDGAISGAVFEVDAERGSVLCFDGIDDQVVVPDAPAFTVFDAVTLQAWVKPRSNAGWRSVVMKERAGGLLYALYSANGAQRPAGYVHNGGDQAVAGPAALALDTWSHLAVTFGGGRERLYVNGVLVRTRTVSGNVHDGAGPLSIGGNGVWGEWFDGCIDSVRFFDSTRTAAQIAADAAN